MAGLAPDNGPLVNLPDGLPIEGIVDGLRRVAGAVAVVLGGSRAAGRHRPDSDVDLGICYRTGRPLDVAGVRALARRLNDAPDPVVTEIGGWGRWVNGGAWLTIGGRRVDLLYRDLDFMALTIDECLAGGGRPDFWQQPPYGFYPEIYCAEARIWHALWDPEGIVPALKRKVAAYPAALKRRGVNGWLWSAGFTLAGVKQATARGEAYLVAGFLTRAATELIHALYAINETFFMNDKYVYREVAEFAQVPSEFMARVDGVMGGDNSPANLADRVARLEALRDELLALVGDAYTPRF